MEGRASVNIPFDVKRAIYINYTVNIVNQIISGSASANLDYTLQNYVTCLRNLHF